MNVHTNKCFTKLILHNLYNTKLLLSGHVQEAIIIFNSKNKEQNAGKTN